MKREAENIIKGIIAETLIEELFKELNFFVTKLGKEYTVNPLEQLKDFVKSCGGKFDLEKLGTEIKEVTHINVLPDFVIVSPQGKVGLVEVKFRRNAQLYYGDSLVFKTYPEAHMLVLNVEVSDEIEEINQKSKDEQERLMNSRFHIWTRKNNSNNDTIFKEVINLTDWLKKDFDIEPELVKRLITEKYGKLLDKYLSIK